MFVGGVWEESERETSHLTHQDQCMERPKDAMRLGPQGREHDIGTGDRVLTYSQQELDSDPILDIF